MAITHSYVDYGAGNDTTGDGTIGTPWKTLQKAFNTLTRNTTDGNQVNLKAGTAHVNAAALDLTTFVAGGALSATAPLILRGYTSAANDGGIGEIDCGGATMFASAYDYLVLADLECHTFGDANGVAIGGSCVLWNCEIHKGASSPSGRNLINCTNDVRVLNCYIHSAGAGAARGINAGSSLFAAGNYIAIGSSVSGASYSLVCGAGSTITHNIIAAAHAGTTGMYAGYGVVTNNVLRNAAAGTADAIYLDSSRLTIVLTNNIIAGWSGAGGEGVVAANNIGPFGYNAFYNNTANYRIVDQTYLSLTANDVALAADPFTDAANGDFSLTDAAKAALRSLGWPAAYLGAHANTDAHITIGPLQYGPTPAAAGGGFPILGGSVVR